MQTVTGDIYAYALSLPVGFHPISAGDITNIPATPLVNYSPGYIISNGSTRTIVLFSRENGKMVTNTIVEGSGAYGWRVI